MLPRTSSARMAMGALLAGGLLRVLFIVLYRPALLGIPDSGTYVDAAHRNLLLDPVHPAGYPAFLRFVHLLNAHLTTTIAIQHLLGVATAAIFLGIVHRATGSWLLGLIPASILLFDGLTLFTEHAPLSEPLFAFLVACALAATAAAAQRLPWALVTGALIAAATLVRSSGLVLVPVIAGYLTVSGGTPLKRRLGSAGATTAVALSLIAVYVGVQRAHSGVAGLTEADGRIAYSVAAPFADCSRFRPPAGTAALCQSLAERRGSPNQYLWGYPDHGPIPAAGRAAVSPAWRLFGPMPSGDARLAAFARAAIIAQPADYLRQVWGNFTCAWSCGLGRFIPAALSLDPSVQLSVTGFYATGAGRHVAGSRLIAGYARFVEFHGALYGVLLLASLTALGAGGAGVRRVALLNLAAGWFLLVASAAVAADPRYTLPSLGPLAAAAALGLSATIPSLRSRAAASRSPSTSGGARSSPRTWRPRRSG